MKNLLVNKSFEFINKYHKLEHIEQIKIKYGLEVMYYFISKTLILLLIAYFFHLLKEIIIFNIFYIPLRSFAHGFHAKNNLQCWIITIIMYSVLFLSIKYSSFGLVSNIIIITISILSFIVWSPADTEHLPLIRKENRIKLKKLSLATLLIEIVTQFFCYRTIITIAILFETFNINPITYKLFNMRFNNYIYSQNELIRKEV